MYRYTVTTKVIFPRPFTGQADSKEGIEEATRMTISARLGNPRA